MAFEVHPASEGHSAPAETRRRLARLRRWLRQRTGIGLRGAQLEILAAGLEQRARLLREPSWPAYLEWVEKSGRLEQEIERLIPLVTNHESYFFRHPDQLATFRHAVLEPHLAEPWAHPLRVWSAGCAHGEEPYSIAIEAAEAAGRERRNPVEILATDIDPLVIDRARRGLYDARAVRVLPHRYLGRYFRAEPGGLRIGERLADSVTFETHNLLDGVPRGRRPFDAIFCRNVLIYFGTREARRALEHLVGQLVEGGVLFLGPVESLRGRLGGIMPSLEVVQDGEVTFYRRAAASTRHRGLPTRPGGAAPVGREIELGDIERLMGAGRLWEALGRLEARISRRPRDHACRLLRARVLCRLGRWEAGARDCLAVLREAPLDAKAHRGLAELRAQQGRREEAIAIARRALYLDPEDGRTWLLLGDLLDRRREHAESVRAWMNARELLADAAQDETSSSRQHDAELLECCHRRLGRTDRSPEQELSP